MFQLRGLGTGCLLVAEWIDILRLIHRYSDGIKIYRLPISFQDWTQREYKHDQANSQCSAISLYCIGHLFLFLSSKRNVLLCQQRRDNFLFHWIQYQTESQTLLLQFYPEDEMDSGPQKHELNSLNYDIHVSD